MARRLLSPWPMMTRALTMLLLLSAGPAAAQPSLTAPTQERDRWDDRPWVIAAHVFSFGAPAGTFAVELEREIGARISASVATGVSSAGKQQVATMLRLRIPGKVAAFGFGGGASQGDYQEFFVLFGPPARREDAVWGNGEFFTEVRSQRGFTFRGYAGFSAMMSSGPCTAGGEPCDGYDLPDSMPYIGSAIGGAF